MESSLYFTFVIISFGFIVVPGPNILVIIGTSLSQGREQALKTIAGVSLAMALQLFVVIFSTTWIVNTLTTGFVWLKWLGVLYLFYLGVVNIRSFLCSDAKAATSSTVALFGKGFLVSLTNPKTIIFFSAFLPQFVSPGASFSIQMLILAGTFLLIALIVDIGYAVFADKLGGMISSKSAEKANQGLSSVVYFGASSVLATTNKA